MRLLLHVNTQKQYLLRLLIHIINPVHQLPIRQLLRRNRNQIRSISTLILLEFSAIWQLDDFLSHEVEEILDKVVMLVTTQLTRICIGYYLFQGLTLLCELPMVEIEIVREYIAHQWLLRNLLLTNRRLSDTLDHLISILLPYLGNYLLAPLSYLRPHYILV